MVLLLHQLSSQEQSFDSLCFKPIAELYTKKMFELLLSAYSTISIQDTALFLGKNEDDAANCKFDPCFTY